MAGRASSASGGRHVEDFLARGDVQFSLGNGDVVIEVSCRRPRGSGTVDRRRDLVKADAAPSGQGSQERACPLDEADEERPVLETHVVDGLEVVGPFLHGDV